jgi:acyl-[acyl-carrier-protein]-phospholipid O-acyltransferase/long-chain-fatty-acid--[acyl-carrier-protein] ligase
VTTEALAIGCLALLEPLAELPVWVLVVLGIGLFALAWLARRRLARLPLGLGSRALYRTQVHGLENVPAEGPALLVANRDREADALLLQAVLRRRVRFLLWAPFPRRLGLPWLLRLLRVIAIDSSGGPRAILQALRTAGDALAQGELVCLFSEAGVTRTGFALPFQRALEQVSKRTAAPIVPVYLTHIGGGRFRAPVSITVGPPLPAEATPFEVSQAVQLLSAEDSVRRAAARRPVHRQFVRLAARHPFRVCVIDPGGVAKKVFRYGEVLAGAKILAGILRPVLGEDRMVGVWLPPSAGVAFTNISLALLGKTAVNLNYTSSAEGVQSALRQCGIRRVLTSRLFTARVRLDPGPGVEVIYLDDFRKDFSRWRRLRALLGVLLLPAFVQERLLGLTRHTGDDLATVIFSSGSTGEPKGVMLTHANIAANAESMIEAIHPGPHDRLVGILPFFHSFGYTVTLWVPLQVGAAVVYHPNPLQAREIGELCRTYGGTILLSTPTFLRSYLKRCGPGDFASLRLLICGAEKLPQPLALEFQARFGVLPLEGYGCTELSPVAAANVPDRQEGAVRQVGNKPGTIGRPLPGVAARIADRQTLAPLPAGEEGLLLMYGANVMKGYLGRDDLTRRKVLDGWYVTGDLACLDEDGFIKITGREERFAKVGGEMVPLERVEEELHIILRTSERTCVVTAIPDERKGERLVVLHLPLCGTDVHSWWQQLCTRGLPNIYIPGQRDFFQVPELPVLGTGKLDLRRCKEKALELARAS